MKEIEIDLTFKTVDFMKSSFIIDILGLIGFKEKYDLQECWGNVKGKYLKEELLKIFHEIPFYAPYLKLIFKEEDIELEISNSWISGFSNLIIKGICNTIQSDKIMNELCHYFEDRFYSILCYDIEFGYKQSVDCPYDNALTEFLGLCFVDTNPGYIFNHYGLHFGSCWKMYYGKYFYSFISKEKLLSFNKAYENYEESNIVKTTLFKNIYAADTTENMKIQREYKKYMGFKKLDKFCDKNWYYKDENNTNYLKGYEDERCYYIEDKPKNKYMIELLSDKTLVLKKYKNSVFYFMDDDLGVSECYALFLYTSDGNFPSDTSVEEPPARLSVMTSCIRKSVKEDALEYGYKYKRISTGHCVLEKEDANKIEIRHLYKTKENEEYEINLEVTKSKLTEEELTRVLDEYNKIIKSKRVRGIE